MSCINLRDPAVRSANEKKKKKKKKKKKARKKKNLTLCRMDFLSGSIRMNK